MLMNIATRLLNNFRIDGAQNQAPAELTKHDTYRVESLLNEFGEHVVANGYHH